MQKFLDIDLVSSLSHSGKGYIRASKEPLVWITGISCTISFASKNIVYGSVYATSANKHRLINLGKHNSQEYLELEVRFISQFDECIDFITFSCGRTQFTYTNTNPYVFQVGKQYNLCLKILLT